MAQDMTRQQQQAPESYREQVDVIAPPVDVLESDHDFLLRADMPGVAEDDVSINLEKEELTVHGKRQIPDKLGDAVTRDFREADYYRTFIVPGTIDADKVSAELKNGVLWLTLPKSEKARPRRIEVKSR